MKVFVEDDDRSVESMFFEAGWGIVSSPNDADLICFTGGADINPKLYDEEPNGARGWDDIRDQKCVLLYETFVGETPMVGICRGGQFLNVMNGGSMIQHIDGHSMGDQLTHMLKNSRVYPKEYIETRGDHHQAIIAHQNGEVIASGCENSRNWDSPTQDVVWYEGTQCLCFQPHPEWGHEPTRELFFSLIKEYIFCAD